MKVCLFFLRFVLRFEGLFEFERSLDLKGALFFKGVCSIEGPLFVYFGGFALLFECLHYFLRFICL